jgi:5-(aminomethyl)-3-furanmethanol phosphate kinase
MSTIRILKLGGSLLVRPEWPARLRAWLRTEPAAVNLLIVGGGEIVDAVRDLDAVHHLDQVELHWLCVDLLAATFQISSQLLPEFELIHDSQQLQNLFASLGTTAGAKRGAGESQAGNYLVQVAAFYSRTIHTTLLEEGWSTTSDSLAAWLASQSQADELVLLKSVSAPKCCSDPRSLVSLGIVDEGLPAIWGERPGLRIVNLAESLSEV